MVSNCQGGGKFVIIWGISPARWAGKSFGVGKADPSNRMPRAFALIYAPVQRTPPLGRRTFTGSLYFCAVHARTKMNLNLFAFGELCEAFFAVSGFV